MKRIIILSLLVFATKLSNAQTQVTFYTNMGKFIVEMYDTITPLTSGNFIDLVNQKFYDGVIFHRVIDNFMIQGGDPTGTGYGGPGYTIPDEFDSRARNLRKTISMANSGPNTGGSQFFINLVNNTYLDSLHAVFGIVTDSFEVVQAIGNVATDANDRPLTDVIMDSLRVTYSPIDTADTTSISEKINQFDEIKVFPNPARDVLSIKLDLKNIENISLLDITGKVIMKIPVTAQQDSKSVTFTLPIGLSKGIYLLKILTDKGQVIKKVAINH